MLVEAANLQHPFTDQNYKIGINECGRNPKAFIEKFLVMDNYTQDKA